jgi:hypothetical protein
MFNQEVGYIINDDTLQQVYQFKTLELADKGNQMYVSCIPTGAYIGLKRTSEKYGEHIHILDTPGRDMILIHSMNYYFQSKGCIGVGDSFADINNDGYNDVLNSRVTLDKILEQLDRKFIIVIV